VGSAILGQAQAQADALKDVTIARSMRTGSDGNAALTP
jgi:hypothetical protein